MGDRDGVEAAVRGTPVVNVDRYLDPPVKQRLVAELSFDGICDADRTLNTMLGVLGARCLLGMTREERAAEARIFSPMMP